MFHQEFIELDRHFTPIPKDQTFDESLERHIALGYAQSTTTWRDILTKRLVVILAEAGAGKTEEMASACQKLREENKSSFFMRLEHLADDFEDSFDVGDADEFREWKRSDSDSWIFLDSVDEARLQAPADFEKAIRKLASKLGSDKARCHIFISSRVSEWRPEFDLAFITEKLASPKKQHIEEDNEVAEPPSSQSSSAPLKQGSKSRSVEEPEVFALCQLNKEQILVFSRAVGLSDPEEFLSQIVRHDAMAFASRPQDLIELIEFWQCENRIGSRYELVENYVNARLTETDPKRARERDLPFEKAVGGAQMLAAAVTLTKQTRIRTPGAAGRKNALATNELLNQWTEKACAALLERPIFDKAMYGTVRFHHRQVRLHYTLYQDR